MHEAEIVSSIPITLSQNFRLSKVQQGLCIKNHTRWPPMSMQTLTINLSKILICEESAIIMPHTEPRHFHISYL